MVQLDQSVLNSIQSQIQTANKIKNQSLSFNQELNSYEREKDAKLSSVMAKVTGVKSNTTKKRSIQSYIKEMTK